MVVLRRSTRRSARIVGSAAKSANPARASSSNSVPLHSNTNPPIPVTIATNPAPEHILITSFPILAINLSSDSLYFGGIQYYPCFLTSGDNSGTSLISEVLDGFNYNTWNIAMTIALDAKNKISFVDGSLPRLAESHPHYRIWFRCNSMVKSWILNSVTKPIYGSILRFNNASKIWKDLNARFHLTNLPRSYQLTQQIWSRQQGCLDLSSYYTKLLNSMP